MAFEENLVQKYLTQKQKNSNSWRYCKIYRGKIRINVPGKDGTMVILSSLEQVKLQL